MGASVVLRYAGLIGGSGRGVSVSGPGRWYYRGTGRCAGSTGRWRPAGPHGRPDLAEDPDQPGRVGPGAVPPDEAAALISPIPLLIVHGDQDGTSRSTTPSSCTTRPASPRSCGSIPGFGHAERAPDAPLIDRIGRWVRGARASRAGCRRCRGRRNAERRVHVDPELHFVTFARLRCRRAEPGDEDAFGSARPRPALLWCRPTRVGDGTASRAWYRGVACPQCTSTSGPRFLTELHRRFDALTRGRAVDQRCVFDVLRPHARARRCAPRSARARDATRRGRRATRRSCGAEAPRAAGRLARGVQFGLDQVHRRRADELGHEQVGRPPVKLLWRGHLLQHPVTHHRHPVPSVIASLWSWVT